MDLLRQRLNSALSAVSRMGEVLKADDSSDILRDAAIQRFEFTFEAVWKCAKEYLQDVHGLDLSSPKSVIRACREVGLMDDLETTKALRMVDDRNLTSHTYNEDVAKKIFAVLCESVA